MPDPALTPTSPVSGQRLIARIGTVLVMAAFLFIAGAFVVTRVRGCQDRERKFLEEIRTSHPGRIAWHSDGKIYILDSNQLGTGEPARRLNADGKLQRIAWSRDGRTLYVIVDIGGMLHTTHLIEAIDIQTSGKRVVLNLKEAKLEDDQLDLEEFWVGTWGEVEAEQERLYFRLDSGDWYSVESKRPRVRSEPGRPANAWDQTRCPDGRHWLAHVSSDDDDYLQLEGEGIAVSISGKNDADDAGAWWCER